MRQFYPDPRFIYELRLSYANYEIEKLMIDKHERWIKDLMIRTSDESGYSVGAFDAGAFRIAKKHTDDLPMYMTEIVPFQTNLKAIRYDPPEYPPYYSNDIAARNRRMRFFERAVNPYYRTESGYRSQNETDYGQTYYEPK